MALSYGFYNSINHDRQYDAIQFGQIFDGIISDGVYANYKTAFVVKASATLGYVVVQPGRAWFNHTWTHNDADLPVKVLDAEVVLDRIDALVLDINSEQEERQNTLQWVKGTPSSANPQKPTDFANTDTHHQYPLCYVFRHFDSQEVAQADIENAIGTSLCPFVTGIIDTINIDQLLLQWDDEFHTWEDIQKRSFESWMLNEESVWTAWFNSMKSQMNSDLSDVEAWVQSIKDVIDSETASRLQAEIDELKRHQVHGSYIKVTTPDIDLYNRTVTITDEEGNTYTSRFDETGVALFESVRSVGTLTLTASTGERDAINHLITPYFGSYEVELALFMATINIVGTPVELLAGRTVVITNSADVTIGTVVLNAEGKGSYTVTYADTYTLTCEY